MDSLTSDATFGNAPSPVFETALHHSAGYISSYLDKDTRAFSFFFINLLCSRHLAVLELLVIFLFVHKIRFGHLVIASIIETFKVKAKSIVYGNILTHIVLQKDFDLVSYTNLYTKEGKLHERGIAGCHDSNPTRNMNTLVPTNSGVARFNLLNYERSAANKAAAEQREGVVDPIISTYYVQ